MAAGAGGSGGGGRHWLQDEDPGFRSAMLQHLTMKLAPYYQPRYEPYSQEAQRFVAKFEEGVFSGTNSKEDYVRNISNKLISIEKRKREELQRRMQSRSLLRRADAHQDLQGSNSSLKPEAVMMASPRPTLGANQQEMDMQRYQMLGAQQSDSAKIQTTSASPIQAEIAPGQAEDQAQDGDKTSVIKKPIDRLIDAMRSSSPAALRISANSIWSVLSISDIVPPGRIGTILDCKSSQRLQFGGSNAVNKMKRVFNTTASCPASLLSGSIDGSCMSFDCDTSDSGWASEISIKRQKTQSVNDALLEEIKSVNSTLIDTVISMSGDGGTDGTASRDGGTTIKLSYIAVSLSPTVKSVLATSETSLVLPTKLFIPPDYPSSSPVVINPEGDEVLSKNPCDISASVDVAFRHILRDLPEPRSIKETARAWDACVRKAVTEFAQRHGGGMVSSMLGCVAT